MVFVRSSALWLTAWLQLEVGVFVRPPEAASSQEEGYVALMAACLVVLRVRGRQPEEGPANRRVFLSPLRVRARWH